MGLSCILLSLVEPSGDLIGYNYYSYSKIQTISCNYLI